MSKSPTAHRAPESLALAKEYEASIRPALDAFRSDPTLENEIAVHACIELAASQNAELARSLNDHPAGFKFTAIALRASGQLLPLYKRQLKLARKSTLKK